MLSILLTEIGRSLSLLYVFQQKPILRHPLVIHFFVPRTCVFLFLVLRSFLLYRLLLHRLVSPPYLYLSRLLISKLIKSDLI